MTVSRADLPVAGWRSTGMPRPLSDTVISPLGSMDMSTLLQNPAIASSTELSSTSKTRWWSPLWSVEPMYMPGRTRTASSPSSTWMSAEV